MTQQEKLKKIFEENAEWMPQGNGITETTFIRVASELLEESKDPYFNINEEDEYELWTNNNRIMRAKWNGLAGWWRSKIGAHRFEPHEVKYFVKISNNIKD
jgi:hypothetical protein